MFGAVLANLSPLLFALALGAALVGLLVWLLAAQGAAQKRTAWIFWGVALALALGGLFSLFQS
ncbi:hypothetical protein DV704_06805 [Meiothermus sp. QL-1]|uniref:hypothetical protein n=1 Tax=Meiothermus sp. QL-1 TaxID=2058095 RepID=UPI000E0CBEF5|nr:hypothetical protein [Meiothermus sp. QL-1]RDI95582.1 hypothetical protein DV704_06805 [Meiothermus sp. QL-1]